jgi:hypothetical protein
MSARQALASAMAAGLRLVGSAPMLCKRLTLPGEPVIPATLWPAAINKGTRRRPRTPVAPATNIFIEMNRLVRSTKERLQYQRMAGTYGSMGLPDHPAPNLPLEGVPASHHLELRLVHRRYYRCNLIGALGAGGLKSSGCNFALSKPENRQCIW